MIFLMCLLKAVIIPTLKDIQTVLTGDYLEAENFIPDGLYRESDFMQQEVFNTYHSETDMMRYIKEVREQRSC